MTKIYSTFKNIYPGPHSDAWGHIDDRVYFKILIDMESDGSYNYLVFPYGGEDFEVVEVNKSLY